MQGFIALVTVGLYVVLRQRWIMAAMFFVMMQVGAVVGAWWGHRLRKRLHPQLH
ncbi:MAG: hypothetical protein ABJA82_01730 [Myxococcales bacterium]